jgi:cell wall-associated NlpC family hydrolase
VRRLAVALVVAFALPATAHAASPPAAEIRDSNGVLIRQIGVGAYSSPDDFGYLLTIGSARRDVGGLTLNDVSILGGRIRLARMTLPASGTAGARIDGLQVAGFDVRARPNLVLQVGDGGYAVILQQAALPGRLGQDTGIVGLRLVTHDRQILVGVARAQTPAQSNRRSPFGLFGLAPIASVGGPSPFAGFVIPTNGGGGARAVSSAEGFLGVPYVWGGASPEYGFDCSGLVMYVYEQLGIHLSHFSGAQWSEGTRIPLEELAPGDLVFFYPGASGPGHVGIYIGGNNFIHAPHSGDVVRISSLYEYSASYVGAVRPR